MRYLFVTVLLLLVSCSFKDDMLILQEDPRKTNIVIHGREIYEVRCYDVRSEKGFMFDNKLVARKILPDLHKGDTIFCDRMFLYVKEVHYKK